MKDLFDGEPVSLEQRGVARPAPRGWDLACSCVGATPLPLASSLASWSRTVSVYMDGDASSKQPHWITKVDSMVSFKNQVHHLADIACEATRDWNVRQEVTHSRSSKAFFSKIKCGYAGLRGGQQISTWNSLDVVAKSKEMKSCEHLLVVAAVVEDNAEDTEDYVALLDHGLTRELEARLSVGTVEERAPHCAKQQLEGLKPNLYVLYVGWKTGSYKKRLGIDDALQPRLPDSDTSCRLRAPSVSSRPPSGGIGKRQIENIRKVLDETGELFAAIKDTSQALLDSTASPEGSRPPDKNGGGSRAETVRAMLSRIDVVASAVGRLRLSLGGGGNGSHPASAGSDRSAPASTVESQRNSAITDMFVTGPGRPESAVSAGRATSGRKSNGPKKMAAPGVLGSKGEGDAVVVMEMADSQLMRVASAESGVAY